MRPVFNAVVGARRRRRPGGVRRLPGQRRPAAALDAAAPITGVIALHRAPRSAGAGRRDARGARQRGRASRVGSTTRRGARPDRRPHAGPFAITPDPAHGGADIQALDLRVHVHGPNVYSGYISLNGNSYVDLPTYAPSVNKAVEISVDDASFANPVPARLSGLHLERRRPDACGRQAHDLRPVDAGLRHLGPASTPSRSSAERETTKALTAPRPRRRCRAARARRGTAAANEYRRRRPIYMPPPQRGRPGAETAADLLHPGSSPGRRRAGAGNMAYFGGHVQVQPKVYLVFWGWGQAGAFDHVTPGIPTSDPDGAAARMTAFMRAMGGTAWAGVADPVLHDRERSEHQHPEPDEPVRRSLVRRHEPDPRERERGWSSPRRRSARSRTSASPT